MSNPYDPPSADNVIRITTDEAMSDHVDDLLNRQASMMGEQGMTAKRRRRWYYSNWFVFFVAGTIAASAAIVLLEPYYNDYHYVQGTVTQVSTVAGPNIVELEGRIFELPYEVTVDGKLIYLAVETQQYHEDGSLTDFDIASLSQGDEAGFYIKVGETPDGDKVGGAFFVIDSPPAETRTSATFQELESTKLAASLLLFPIIAATVGFAIAAADGLMCRLWRRVFVGGVVGMIIGFLGGFLSAILAGFIYYPINMMAQRQMDEAGEVTAMAFTIQVTGRGLAWCLAGMAMGLGQGVSLRSPRLLLYGFLGGTIGGLLGGLLFDPIAYLGAEGPSAHVSRFVGITIIGSVVGLMIGVVELLARDAWLQMVQGPLSGKEFLVFKDRVNVGASPRSDIYLFNDEDVADHHATIRSAADQYELETVDPVNYPVLINGRQVQRTRLRHGDQITLGKTIFTFQRRNAG